MQFHTARQNFIEVLSTLYDIGEAKSLARIVFEDVFSVHTRSVQFSESDKKKLYKIQLRLLQGEPLQYILGQADFFGLKIKVSPAVLIPRQETEELVALMIETLGENFVGSILDIGTGSGCIPIALKKHLKNASISACDISFDALEIARKNAINTQTRVDFSQCNFLEKDARSKLENYDVLVSNPPYIPRKEAGLMPESVKAYEPSLALFVEDNDPLIFYQVIADFAKQHLNVNGHLYFELNEYNAEEVLKLVKEKGFQQVKIHKDLNGKSRMLSCMKKKGFKKN